MKTITFIAVLIGFGLSLVSCLSYLFQINKDPQVVFISLIIFIWAGICYILVRIYPSKMFPIVLLLSTIGVGDTIAQDIDSLRKADSINIRYATAFKVRSHTNPIKYIINKPGVRTIYISKNGRKFYYVQSRTGRIYKKYLN